MILLTDFNGNAIQVANKIDTENLTLLNTEPQTITKPQNAVAVRVYSDDYFEIIAGTSGFKTNDDEFGCASLESFKIKGEANQVVYLRWVLV